MLPKEVLAFHGHLDECQRCREHPFDLCSVGAKKLKEAVTVQGNDLPRSNGRFPT